MTNVNATKMKKPLQHKWDPIPNQFKTDICTKCGIVRKWDARQFRYVFYKTWLNGCPIGWLKYGPGAPECILENCTMERKEVKI